MVAVIVEGEAAVEEEVRQEVVLEVEEPQEVEEVAAQEVERRS